jgi:tubulin polyglutamylase TTLL6/13
MKRHFPKEYAFYPDTFVLPTDHFLLTRRLSISTHSKQPTQNQFYIVKPENGTQGKGIFLINGLSSIERKLTGVVVQKYISKPKLIDGLKFDMRVFVLITNLQPLRLYLYRDGLARFATEKFE